MRLGPIRIDVGDPQEAMQVRVVGRRATLEGLLDAELGGHPALTAILLDEGDAKEAVAAFEKVVDILGGNHGNSLELSDVWLTYYRESPEKARGNLITNFLTNHHSPGKTDVGGPDE